MAKKMIEMYLHGSKDTNWELAQGDGTVGDRQRELRLRPV